MTGKTMKSFGLIVSAMTIIIATMSAASAKGVLRYDPKVGITIKQQVEKPFLGTISKYLEGKVLILEQINENDLKVLAEAKEHVKRLKITNSPALSSLSNLSMLSHVEILELDGLPQIQDLSALSALTKLRSLHVKQVNVRDISFVSALSSLETLVFVQQPKERLDITPLQKRASLRTLRFGGARIEDISPIASLVSLRELSLAETQVTDLAALSNLVLLEKLDLSGIKATSMRPIEHLKNLTWLRISSTRFHDYQVLANFVKLQTLIAGESRFNRLDVIESMPLLTTLKLYREPIRNLDSLMKATQLETLYLRNMSVNLNALSHLGGLKHLSLEKAKITNPEGISRLVSVETLDLRGVINLKELSLLLPLSKLKRVYVLRGDYPANQTALLGKRVIFQ